MEPETRVSQPHPSLVRIEATGVFALLQEHRLSLAAAASVIARMRGAPRDRDEEGLTVLIHVVAAIKVSASYLGRTTLREVAVDLERLLDRQLLARSAAVNGGVFDLLEASFAYMDAELKALQTGLRAENLDKNGLTLCERMDAYLGERSGALPGADAFLEAFKEDSLRHLDSCREAIVSASERSGSVLADALHSAFRAMHTLKGNAGLLGLADFEDMGRAVEQVLDGLRSSVLVLTSNLSIALLDLLDVAAAGVRRLKGVNFSAEISALEVAEAEAKLVAKRTRLGDLLVESNIVTREQVDLVLSIKRDPLGVALMRLNALGERQLADALELQRSLRAGEDRPSIAPQQPGPRLVQVEAPALERLQRRIAAAAERCRTTAPGVSHELAELRDMLLAMGRVPLRRMFQKTMLLVNDLARQQDKSVRLALEGEGLQVAEELAAPLADAVVHLARNAVDHGIESQAERRARGKPAEGQITLVARELGDGLIIEMTDDGRGLDRARILRRAVELGVLSEAASASLSDAQVAELVFAPGLSTAPHVTDTSGRGVGMDAVRNSIERAGGTVAIGSPPEGGTRVRLTFARR